MYLLVATSGGYAKRTAIEEYTVQGRGGKGILTIQYDRRRGTLVGALIVDDVQQSRRVDYAVRAWAFRRRGIPRLSKIIRVASERLRV